MAKTETKTISKRLRFEVFKRDKFSCQYCGESAPDVILHIDHINPKSKGGSNDIVNLITACASCNLGKSDRKLSDESAAKKSKAQLDELQERRNQIEMIAEWQKQLAQVDDDMLEVVCNLWNEFSKSFYINETGRAELRKTIKKFGFDNTLRAVRISAQTYLKFVDGVATEESCEDSLRKIGGICYNMIVEQKYPNVREQYIVWKVLYETKRAREFDKGEALSIMRKALDAGIDMSEIDALARKSYTYYQWKTSLRSWILAAQNG